MDLQKTADFYYQHREAYPEPFRLRIHRSLSWLKRAMRSDQDWICASLGAAAQRAKVPWDKLPVDWDMRFITLWIAFNAAYADEIDNSAVRQERPHFRSFLQTVCLLDKSGLLHGLVWETFSGHIRLLLDNQFIFQPFWDFHNGKIGEAEWLESFSAAKKKAQTALLHRETDLVLFIVFDRLYTLRNQLVHGGSTFNSQANRVQLKDACGILSSIVPAILYVMQQYPDNDWGRPYYPYVRG